jgi:hypothetical protein
MLTGVLVNCPNMRTSQVVINKKIFNHSLVSDDALVALGNVLGSDFSPRPRNFGVGKAILFAEAFMSQEAHLVSTQGAVGDAVLEVVIRAFFAISIAMSSLSAQFTLKSLEEHNAAAVNFVKGILVFLLHPFVHVDGSLANLSPVTSFARSFLMYHGLLASFEPKLPWASPLNMYVHVGCNALAHCQDLLGASSLPSGQVLVSPIGFGGFFFFAVACVQSPVTYSRS